MGETYLLLLTEALVQRFYQYKGSNPTEGYCICCGKKVVENTDGFIPVNAEEVPFEEDADFMEELQGELEDDASDSEVEAAKKFVCDFGVFKGKTMEQVMESGVKGTETMKWIVNKYKGPNKELVKAAKTLLDYQSESEELRAA